jgi:hypothetical protein
MMRSLRPLLLLVSLVVCSACSAGCRPATPATTSLRVTGAPPDAQVTIDDQVLGPLSYVTSRGVALPPGQHRLTVEHPGYFPLDRIIEAREGEKLLELDVRLEKIPD